MAIAGPGSQATGFPLLHLAKEAIRGHAAIAERVREQAGKIAAEHDEQRAMHDYARQAATAALSQGSDSAPGAALGH